MGLVARDGSRGIELGIRMIDYDTICRRHRRIYLTHQLVRAINLRGAALISELQVVLRSITLGAAPGSGLTAAVLDETISSALQLAMLSEMRLGDAIQQRALIDHLLTEAAQLAVMSGCRNLIKSLTALEQER